MKPCYVLTWLLLVSVCLRLKIFSVWNEEMETGSLAPLKQMKVYCPCQGHSGYIQLKPQQLILCLDYVKHLLYTSLSCHYRLYSILEWVHKYKLYHINIVTCRLYCYIRPSTFRLIALKNSTALWYNCCYNLYFCNLFMNRIWTSDFFYISTLNILRVTSIELLLWCNNLMESRCTVIISDSSVFREQQGSVLIQSALSSSRAVGALWIKTLPRGGHLSPSGCSFCHPAALILCRVLQMTTLLPVEL